MTANQQPQPISVFNAEAGDVRVAGNLFDMTPRVPEDHEIFETLLSHANVRIERIVSTGQVSPEGFWYDQSQAEWVFVVQGTASVQFEDERNARDLKAGDYLYIAPHRRHRVQYTQTTPPTIWLAVHIENPNKPQVSH
ncbi:MAG: cupin domain-containing protein [Burkholderiaceae bacterium]|nr:cupin domain-containing protein [Burkholderiaceae bacterium]MCD8517198.1 cupin domain-containing protein [Burkholderiaceae bacterium]MCD8536466.1 cupin domain-containing protein [Burkholderiaceae bacterium]MCD8565255.1 cupin domain-containing protein [Burkholderiaceae bacterium]